MRAGAEKWAHCYRVLVHQASVDGTFLCSLFDVAEMREKPIQLIHEHDEPDETFQVYELRNLCDFIVHLSRFIDEANEAQRGEESHLGSHSKPGQGPNVLTSHLLLI